MRPSSFGAVVFFVEPWCDVKRGEKETKTDLLRSNERLDVSTSFKLRVEEHEISIITLWGFKQIFEGEIKTASRCFNAVAEGVLLSILNSHQKPQEKHWKDVSRGKKFRQIFCKTLQEWRKLKRGLKALSCFESSRLYFLAWDWWVKLNSNF